MIEIDWKVMDKDKIIDLILDHNAAIDVLSPEMRRRIKGKLENMDAARLFKHIENTYDGVLYGPDAPTVVDDSEKRRRERIYDKQRIERPEYVPDTNVVVPRDRFTLLDDAHNDLYGKKCVQQVFVYGQQLVVIPADHKKVSAIRRYVARKYPGMWITIIGEEEGADAS
jgi:hypothetical protein